MADMQNPAGTGGAWRNQLGGWLRQSSTALDWQAQTLVTRFYLSPWMAREVSRLCFGEGCRDD